MIKLTAYNFETVEHYWFGRTKIFFLLLEIRSRYLRYLLIFVKEKEKNEEFDETNEIWNF
ncbi:hypothetical protein GvMRE_IIg390 [endosymbiont GvMRE of Glomus versiforme]|nr:hypothetical protein GvMRE_IIg390 [endosymbiont GvMRE of Glomus versiforme]